MDQTVRVLAGVGLGAGLMYLLDLDPVRGRSRQALVRNQFTRLTHEARDGADVV